MSVKRPNYIGGLQIVPRRLAGTVQDSDEFVCLGIVGVWMKVYMGCKLEMDGRWNTGEE
jgi:hypothetical protein